ncbi:MAG: AlpA family phage regulatory protein [Gallionella sp.]
MRDQQTSTTESNTACGSELHNSITLKSSHRDLMMTTPRNKHPITLLRLPAVLERRGRSRSSHYADIKAGLFVKPVLIGLRATGTPDYEVDALIAARIAGKTDEEIRALVIRLEADRKAVT